MSRRRRKQQSSPKGFIIAGVIAIALVAGFLFLKSLGEEKTTGSFSELPIDTYYANSENLIGNNYSIEGKVERRDRINTEGQLITLTVETSSGPTPIPVLIPSNIGNMNIEPGFRIRLDVRVNADGIPEATAVSDL